MTFIRAGKKSMNLFEKKINEFTELQYFTKLNCNVELLKLLQNQKKNTIVKQKE